MKMWKTKKLKKRGGGEELNLACVMKKSNDSVQMICHVVLEQACKEIGDIKSKDTMCLHHVYVY